MVRETRESGLRDVRLRAAGAGRAHTQANTPLPALESAIRLGSSLEGEGSTAPRQAFAEVRGGPSTVARKKATGEGREARRVDVFGAACAEVQEGACLGDGGESRVACGGGLRGSGGRSRSGCQAQASVPFRPSPVGEDMVEFREVMSWLELENLSQSRGLRRPPNRSRDGSWALLLGKGAATATRNPLARVIRLVIPLVADVTNILYVLLELVLPDGDLPSLCPWWFYSFLSQ